MLVGTVVEFRGFNLLYLGRSQTRRVELRRLESCDHVALGGAFVHDDSVDSPLAGFDVSHKFDELLVW